MMVVDDMATWTTKAVAMASNALLQHALICLLRCRRIAMIRMSL
jgi:hypothetical protein